MLKSVIKRTMLAAGLLGTLAMAAPPSEAKTSVQIWIGNGYWNGPGYYHGHYRHRVSCWEGAAIVDHSGYSWVRAIDCHPRYYLYKANRRGARFIVKLDSRWGNIISATRD
jgi:hypothetical protein